MAKTSVLVVGLEPSLIDFSDPAYGASGLDAAAVRASLEADEAHLRAHLADVCDIERLAGRALVALQGGAPEVRDGGKLTARLQGVAEAAEVGRA